MHTIRQAKSRDIPRLLALLTQVNMVHHNGRPDLFNGPTTKYDVSELEELLNDDKVFLFVCVNDQDEVLGYAFCFHQQPLDNKLLKAVKTLYIDDICVDENARHQHVGTTLYEHVKQFAKEKGYYNITLNVWSLNPGAQAFYESLGMKPYRIGMEEIL